MKNNVFILCSIIAVGALVVGTYFSIVKKSTQEENTNTAKNKTDNIEQQVALTTPSTNLLDKNLPSDFPPPDHTIAPTTSNTLWSTEQDSYHIAPNQYAHLSQQAVDRAFIKIGRLEIEALEAGAPLTVAIPQTGNRYEAEVSTTQYHPNGDKTVTAIIQSSDNEPHSITITQGQQGTFGTLSTPDGVYVLEADTTHGWIASKDDLVKLQDRSVTDEVHMTPDNSDLPPS